MRMALACWDATKVKNSGYPLKPIPYKCFVTLIRVTARLNHDDSIASKQKNVAERKVCSRMKMQEKMLQVKPKPGALS